MKTIILSIILLLNFLVVIKGQTIDTVNTYGFGKMPPIYMGNILYWDRHYESEKGDDSNVKLTYICLSYNDCRVGVYTGFYPGGKIKETGQYKGNTSDDWSDLKKRGLCSIPDGEWKQFSEDGILTKTIFYENGTVVKEY